MESWWHVSPSYPVYFGVGVLCSHPHDCCTLFDLCPHPAGAHCDVVLRNKIQGWQDQGKGVSFSHCHIDVRALFQGVFVCIVWCVYVRACVCARTHAFCTLLTMSELVSGCVCVHCAVCVCVCLHTLCSNLCARSMHVFHEQERVVMR